MKKLLAIAIIIAAGLIAGCGDTELLIQEAQLAPAMPVGMIEPEAQREIGLSDAQIWVEEFCILESPATDSEIANFLIHFEIPLYFEFWELVNEEWESWILEWVIPRWWLLEMDVTDICFRTAIATELLTPYQEGVLSIWRIEE